MVGRQHVAQQAVEEQLSHVELADHGGEGPAHAAGQKRDATGDAAQDYLWWWGEGQGGARVE
jgi:hypothetical protein